MSGDTKNFFKNKYKPWDAREITLHILISKISECLKKIVRYTAFFFFKEKDTVYNKLNF